MLLFVILFIKSFIKNELCFNICYNNDDLFVEVFKSKDYYFTNSNWSTEVERDQKAILAKSGSVSIHHRNLQQVAIEIYKALNDSSSTLMSELFRGKEKKYNLRNKNALVSNIPHSTNYGINTISHLAPKIWEIIPNEIRCCQSLNLFKEKIKTRMPINCPCNLFRPCMHKVGFI